MQQDWLLWMTFAHFSTCFIYFMSLAYRGASLVNEMAERWLWLPSRDDAPYILLCSLLNGPVLLPASGYLGALIAIRQGVPGGGGGIQSMTRPLFALLQNSCRGHPFPYTGRQLGIWREDGGHSLINITNMSHQCWNFRTIYGGYSYRKNRVGIGLLYRPRQDPEAGGIDYWDP